MQNNISAGTMAVGVMAILAGLVGAYMVRAALLPEPEAAPPEPAKISVPLASTDLPAGRQVVLADVALMSMTRQEMLNRNYPLDVMMLSPEQIIGRQLREPIKLGQPFTTTDMYLQGTGQNIAELLKPGFRAVNVEVPNERGGTVGVGDMVDVMFRSTPRAATDDAPAIPEKTVSLLESVEVLHVERPEISRLQNATGYKAKPPRITLAVTPRQANILQVTDGRGEMSLVVRPPNDLLAGGPDSNQGLTLEELLGIEPKAPPAPPARPPTPFATEVYYGGKRYVNLFPPPLPSPPSTTAPPSSSAPDSSDPMPAAKSDPETSGDDPAAAPVGPRIPSLPN